MDSSPSIDVNENYPQSGLRIFDHQSFLEQEPRARLISITIYGYNYITAIETKFFVPGKDEPAVFLHSGSAHDAAKK